VHLASPTERELEDYIATGEPFEVAGALTIDGLGGAFVRGIEGDHHNVIGLSLPLLRDLLADLGVPWTSLWNRPSA
jgi:septum formation protein